MRYTLFHGAAAMLDAGVTLPRFCYVLRHALIYYDDAFGRHAAAMLLPAG